MQKYAGICSADEKANSFLERGSRKTVKDHMETIVFRIIRIFLQHVRSFENWGISLGSSLVFGHMTCQDQSGTSKNI